MYKKRQRKQLYVYKNTKLDKFLPIVFKQESNVNAIIRTMAFFLNKAIELDIIDEWYINLSETSKLHISYIRLNNHYNMTFDTSKKSI